ncbi:class I SAM-dependent methyltransferase [Streptomyces sp. NPDC056224]|uniref:class I SAM-dependent methyltransferase n=1 Tax=Streptomyces sp. NPDC056224 TaxID=3345750 RepID=UPI0035D8E275
MGDRVRVCVADHHRLPFPDRCFDAAYLLESAICSTDLVALFQEISRVLRPTGVLYVKDSPSPAHATQWRAEPASPGPAPSPSPPAIGPSGPPWPAPHRSRAGRPPLRVPPPPAESCRERPPASTASGPPTSPGGPRGCSEARSSDSAPAPDPRTAQTPA